MSSMTTTEDNISAMQLMVDTDKKVIYQQILTSLGIDMSKVHKILQENLAVRKLCARWIYYNLTKDQLVPRNDVKICRRSAHPQEATLSSSNICLYFVLIPLSGFVQIRTVTVGSTGIESGAERRIENRTGTRMESATGIEIENETRAGNKCEDETRIKNVTNRSRKYKSTAMLAEPRALTIRARHSQENAKQRLPGQLVFYINPITTYFIGLLKRSIQREDDESGRRSLLVNIRPRVPTLTFPKESAPSR
ncbi:hypothetical protein EVAR_80_1 [Eumeta japonica]|uniref:Mariner Mos1 transposase n=1 Tax=Eumeta variegata TaxID=151549 RepID=A0A4C1SAK9_EUMVA|nr:hypothetical protein EVAR_80_1 [Eumeta japonica]